MMYNNIYVNGRVSRTKGRFDPEVRKEGRCRNRPVTDQKAPAALWRWPGWSRRAAACRWTRTAGSAGCAAAWWTPEAACRPDVGSALRCGCWAGRKKKNKTKNRGVIYINKAPCWYLSVGTNRLGCSLCFTSRYLSVAMNDWAWKPLAVPVVTGVWQMEPSVPTVMMLLLSGVPRWPALSRAWATQRTWKRRLK